MTHLPVRPALLEDLILSTASSHVSPSRSSIDQYGMTNVGFMAVPPIGIERLRDPAFACVLRVAAFFGAKHTLVAMYAV